MVPRTTAVLLFRQQFRGCIGHGALSIYIKRQRIYPLSGSIERRMTSFQLCRGPRAANEDRRCPDDEDTSSRGFLTCVGVLVQSGIWYSYERVYNIDGAQARDPLFRFLIAKRFFDRTCYEYFVLGGGRKTATSAVNRNQCSKSTTVFKHPAARVPV